MAKFGINDLIDIKKKESESGTVNAYKEIWLNPMDVKPSESNFYSQENIEELADSFLAVGQQQPTVLARVDGEFRIVSGHRRNLANIKNLERGYREYEKVRYFYKDMTPAMLELSLLIGNALNRELTPWEKTQQAQRLKEALVKARDEDGLEIRGNRNCPKRNAPMGTCHEDYGHVFSREQVSEQMNCVARDLEHRVQLQQLMSHMTAKEKEVVCMRAAGYTYREIAEHCNITMRGVTARLIRMRKRFRALTLI